MNEPNADVADLVARLRAGDDAAVEQLLAAYAGRLRALAAGRIANHPQARSELSDVVQDMWISALRAIREGAAPADPDGLWRLLAAITARKCVNRITHWSRLKRAGTVPLGDADVSGGGDPAEAAEADELVRLVERFVAALDPAVGRVALLRLEGRAIEDIAALTQTSESTVLRRLRDVRERLKGLLSE
jgi:RNA polymerase sigma factor (sigma-70 family)